MNVPRKLECGHTCENKCSEPHRQKCLVPVPYECIHRHKTKKLCHEVQKQTLIKCTVPCRRRLACGHACRGTCYECENGTFHKPCAFCGLPNRTRHTTVSGHGRRIPCVAPCRNQCSHRQCNTMCFEPCADDGSTNWPCREKCGWTCEHQSCTKLCFEQCDRSFCEKPCKNTLRENRPCQGYCGETCGYDALLPFKQVLSMDDNNVRRKSFHKSCERVLHIESSDILRIRDNDPCGLICSNCKKPILIDEKMYGQIVKQIHESKERKKLQSVFYERHREFQGFITMLKLKMTQMDIDNEDSRHLESLFQKRNQSLNDFLHFQRQGSADLKKELLSLERMADDILARDENGNISK